MRRLLMILLIGLCLAPDADPARAQATPDQMNKLSLEALTTPAPGGNPGSPGRRAYQRSFYRSIGRHSSYRRPTYTRRGGTRYAPRSSYRRPGYARPSYRRSGYGRPSYRRPVSRSFRRAPYRSSTRHYAASRPRVRYRATSARYHRSRRHY